MKLHTYIDDPTVAENLKTYAERNGRSVAKETTRIVREHLDRQANPPPSNRKTPRFRPSPAPAKLGA